MLRPDGMVRGGSRALAAGSGRREDGAFVGNWQLALAFCFCREWECECAMMVVRGRKWGITLFVFFRRRQ